VILHILTPIPPPLLENARILVKGKLELPIWGMLDFQDMDEGVASVVEYRIYNGEGYLKALLVVTGDM
jgi:polynucleotide 5'-hydroxyl-kinase GRC3/NOL9